MTYDGSKYDSHKMDYGTKPDSVIQSIWTG
jgi:hypothetical protein